MGESGNEMEFIEIIRKLVLGIIVNITYKLAQKRNRQYDYLFISMRGDKLGPNSELFSEYLEAKNNQVEYKFIDTREDSLNLFTSCMSAVWKMGNCKVVVLDDFFFPLNHIRKIDDRQQIVQLWHALGSYKRIGALAKHRNYDHVFLNSANDEIHYREVFESKKFHTFGMLRPNKYITSEKVGSNLAIKNILFAPTYRVENKQGIYQTWNELLVELKKEYKVTLSLHPYIKLEELDAEALSGVEFISGEAEVLTSLPKYDALITDYSSILFDYSYFEQPIILFTPDLDQYRKKVSFFTEIEEYNLPICKNISEVTDILNDKVKLKENIRAIKAIKDVTFHQRDNMCEMMVREIEERSKIL